MTDMKELRFDVNLDKSDYREAVFYNVMGKNRFALVGTAVVFISCVFYFIAGLLGILEIATWMKLLCLAFIALVATIFILIVNVAKKLMKTDHEYLGSKRHMIVGKAGIFSKRDGEGEEEPVELQWDMVYNGEESKKQFLMFSQTGMLIILPKKSLKGEEISQMREILKVMMQTNFKTRHR